jgi:hypothetical protein
LLTANDAVVANCILVSLQISLAAGQYDTDIVTILNWFYREINNKVVLLNGFISMRIYLHSFFFILT